MVVNVHTRAQPKMCHISMQTCRWTAWWLCPRKQTDLKSVAASSFSLSWYYVEKKGTFLYQLQVNAWLSTNVILSLANSNAQLMLGLVAFLLTLCPLKTPSDAEIRKKRREVEQFSLVCFPLSESPLRPWGLRGRERGVGLGGGEGLLETTQEKVLTFSISNYVTPLRWAALGVTGEGGSSGWRCHFDWNATKRQRSEGGNRRLISSLQAKSEPFQEIQGHQTGRTRSRPKKLLKKKKKSQKT